VPSPADLEALGLTLKLAILTTALLLAVGSPLAWWLATSPSRCKAWVGAVVSLPLVLPPVVLGFYLLMWMGPEGPLGRAMSQVGLEPLPFTFAGLVVASALYSLPFVVQPLQGGFEAIGRRPLELAATLGASPWDRFFTVAVPLCVPSYVTAGVLAFAHTVGEFGVVLMIGGSIPGRTRVLSVALFDHVEALEYGDAHRLAGALLLFSFVVLAVIHWIRAPVRGS
jgi:molybdate transport system permease protein